MVLGKIYIDRVSIWVTFFKHGSNDEGGAIDSVEQGLLAMRTIRRLLIAGWTFPNRSQEVRDIWTILRTHLDEMLGLTADKNLSSLLHISTRRLIEKHLRQIVKLHIDMARTHPAGFALLPGSISNVAFTYWSVIDRLSNDYGTRTPTVLAKPIDSDGNADDEDTTIMEFVSLKGLLLLRACLKMVFNPAQTFRYQKPEDKDEKNQAREVIKESLLTQPFVETMMQTLVTRFFVFRPQDLRDWQEEPNEWERREEGEGDVWEYSIRSCSEKLFLDLMINYKDVLVQPLLQVFQTVASKSATLLLINLSFSLWLFVPFQRIPIKLLVKDEKIFSSISVLPIRDHFQSKTELPT